MGNAAMIAFAVYLLINLLVKPNPAPSHPHDEDKAKANEPQPTIGQVLKQLDNNATLWFRYEPTYHKLNKNPAARKVLKNHPGVKFMRRGWLYLGLLILLLYIIGILGMHHQW